MISLIYFATLAYFWHFYFSTEFVILYFVITLISILIANQLMLLITRSVTVAVLPLLKFIVFTGSFYLVMKLAIKEYYYADYYASHMKTLLLFILSYFAFIAQDLLPHQLRN